MTNKTAMNIRAWVFLCVNIRFYFSGKKIPRSVISGIDKKRMFNILRNCQTHFQSGPTILCPHQKCMCDLLSLHPCQYLALTDFNFSHSHKSMEVCYCDLLCIFQELMLLDIIVFYLHSLYLHWWNVYSSLCPFSNWTVFLLLSLESFLHILYRSPLSDMWCANIFSRVVFSLLISILPFLFWFAV